MIAVRGVVFDIDDVLLDMDTLAVEAVDALVEPLSAHIGSTAKSVADGLGALYEILRRQLRSGAGESHDEAQALVARLHAWQAGVGTQGYQPKLWSRQVMLAEVLRTHGIAPSRALIEPVIEHYWQVIGARSHLFADAQALLARLQALRIPIRFATNSDGHLSFDDQAQTFTYDPMLAVQRKYQRLGPLWALGFLPAQVHVGDPVGKPHPAFAQKVLDAFKKEASLEPASLLVVGDSLNHDLLPFLGLGVHHGVWVLRRESGQAPAGVQIVRSLDEIDYEFRSNP